MAVRVAGRIRLQLLRGGDFFEAGMQSIGEGRIRAGSLLFGMKEFSILDQVDAVVFREAAAGPRSAFRIETHAGSVFFAESVRIAADRLVLKVKPLGEVQLNVDEVRALMRPREE